MPATVEQLRRHADQSRSRFTFATGPQPRLRVEADTAPVNWSDPDVSGLLPTVTVTLLVADVVPAARRVRPSQPMAFTRRHLRMD
ncbi:MAG: hypothetical protein QOE41_1794 [Mycobacterium sp.]|jgi:hypothetical protein|nr:hypothetical protein [Mycobacterium sp.]